MKTLTWTALGALIAGAVTAAITGLTWPHYDPAAAYTAALKAAEWAGADRPDALNYLTAPVDHFLGHTVALAVGGTLLGIGILAGLLTLHARALREVPRG